MSEVKSVVGIQNSEVKSEVGSEVRIRKSEVKTEGKEGLFLNHFAVPIAWCCVLRVRGVDVVGGGRVRVRVSSQG